MDNLTTFKADHIRSLYSSGLYHKSDLFLRFIHEVQTPDNLNKILNYVVYPDVRQDLQMKIFGLTFIFEATDEYHTTLRNAAILEHEMMMADPKKAPAEFEKKKKHASKLLNEKLVFINNEFGTAFSEYDVRARLYRG